MMRAMLPTCRPELHDQLVEGMREFLTMLPIGPPLTFGQEHTLIEVGEPCRAIYLRGDSTASCDGGAFRWLGHADRQLRGDSR
jgi:hypothetical protein